MGLFNFFFGRKQTVSKPELSHVFTTSVTMQDQPPTDRQLQYAAKVGIVVKPGMTRDELSKLIGVAKDTER